MVSASYNPAADEESLNRCVRRLHDIAEESGRIGAFLDQTPRLDPSSRFDERLESAVERNRIPGFCGHRLLLESGILVELVAVRVAVLRIEYEKQGNRVKLAKLERIEAFCEGLGPILQAAADTMSVFSSLDAVEQLKAIVARGRAKEKPHAV